jgi:hypothetical protein
LQGHLAHQTEQENSRVIACIGHFQVSILNGHNNAEAGLIFHNRNPETSQNLRPCNFWMSVNKKMNKSLQPNFVLHVMGKQSSIIFMFRNFSSKPKLYFFNDREGTDFITPFSQMN